MSTDTLSERGSWTLPEIGVIVHADNIVVRPDEDDPDVVARDGNIEQRASGLFVARDGESVPEPTVTGKIVGVGPGELMANPQLQAWVPGLIDAQDQPIPFPPPFIYAPMPYQVGDHISHSKYGIGEVEIAGEKFRLMRLEHVKLRLPQAAGVLVAPTD